MGKKTRQPGVKRYLIAGTAIMGLLLLLVWLGSVFIPCNHIQVVGAEQADEADIRGMARVDTTQALYDIDPAIIEDRVRRHPWVIKTSVTRLPTGALRIRIWERTPVALLLDGQGRPRVYADAEGYVMPPAGAAFDVPLLRGADVIPGPAEPFRNATVRDLLAALGGAGEEVQAVISEFNLDGEGELRLRTAPVHRQGSLTVRMGRLGFAEKLERLALFWRQAVLTQPDKLFSLVDLRFDGQVVTNEKLLTSTDSQPAADPGERSR